MVNKEYLIAGKCDYLVSNPKGDKYHFRIDKRLYSSHGKKYSKPCYFVYGKKYDESFEYLGLLNTYTDTLTTTKNTTDNEMLLNIFKWSLAIIVTNTPLPKGYVIDNAGYCAICSRTLTTEESKIRGYGSTCYERRNGNFLDEDFIQRNTKVNKSYNNYNKPCNCSSDYINDFGETEMCQGCGHSWDKPILHAI